METLLFAAFINDLDRGWLQQCPVEDDHFNQAGNLINRYPDHPLRTLDALHLAVALHAGIDMLASAVMADAASA